MEQQVLGHIAGVPVVTITPFRITKDKQIKGLFYYNLRHDEEYVDDPFSLEKHVWSCHYCTIATSKPIASLEDNSLEWIEVTEQDKQLLAKYY